MSFTPTQLNQIVQVNEEALVANAVNLDMMTEEEKNQRLCSGFVFNYNPDKPRDSTLGVLDILRRSFHSRNEENIHLMVQDYGKGKSHFALTIANYFSQPFDSPEIKGILKQVESACTGKSNAILENLKAHKERTLPFLVIPLTGTKTFDLRQHFLQSLRNVLNAAEVTDSIAQTIIQRPLAYLQEVRQDSGKRAIAQAHLKETGFDGDLSSLIELLEEDNYQFISEVVAISEKIVGYPINFEQDIQIQDLLNDVHENLCSGENRRYQGILILFDEINAYLRAWVASPARGGTALQNLTDFCASHSGEVAVIFFAQVKPSGDTLLSYQDKKSCERFTTRIEQNQSTYEPESSLELVLSDLLIKKPEANWSVFLEQWRDSLLTEGRITYQQHITKYNNRHFPLPEFQEHLAKGCFPLHPLTTYILCNFNFTQGRTVVQFIKEDVKQFLQTEAIDQGGKLNFIFPVQLVDAFLDNFSQKSAYEEYQKAYEQIAATAEPDDITALRALLLYYVCQDNLKKSDSGDQDRAEHEPILEMLTGFSKSKMSTLLTKLTNDSQVIYYNPGTKTYRFYSGGVSINVLREELESRLDEENVKLSRLTEHCRKNIKHYLGGVTLTAEQFVRENRLIAEDWQFEWQICSVDEIERILTDPRTLQKTDKRGILLQVLGEQGQDLRDLRNQINALLVRCPFRQQIIVVIPQRGTQELSHELAVKEALDKMTTSERRVYGAAADQLNQQLEKEVTGTLKEIVSDSTYHCIADDKIASSDRQKPRHIVSVLMRDLYPFAPPTEDKEALKLSSTSGSQIIGFSSRALLRGDLSPQILLNKSYSNLLDLVFATSWRMLKKTSHKYEVQEPIQERVKTAWDKISDMTQLGDRPEKRVEVAQIWQVLIQPPFGYNEYTFTMLLAGWLTYHRSEVSLYGGFGFPKKAADRVSVKEATLEEWAGTDILSKPKDFISKWVTRGDSRPVIIRRKAIDIEVPSTVDYDDARNFLQQIEKALGLQQVDSVKRTELERKKGQLTEGIRKVEKWLEPICNAENLLANPNFETLVRSYPTLAKSLPIELKEGITTVRVSQAQRAHQAQVRQTIGEKVEEIVNALSNRANALENEREYEDYKLEVNNALNTLGTASNLPSHLISVLQNALQVSEQAIVQVQEDKRKQTYLEQIRQHRQSLKGYPTQLKLNQVRQAIETLAQEIPEVQQEPLYEQVLQEVSEHHSKLSQTVDSWVERANSLNDHSGIIELMREIDSQSYRITEIENQRTVQELSSRLASQLKIGQNQDEFNQEIRGVLSRAQQKLQRIRDLDISTKFADVCQVYEDLKDITLPQHNAHITQENYSNYRNDLERLQANARSQITEKLAQICSRRITQLEQCEKLKAYLQKTLDLLAKYPELAEVQGQVSQKLSELDGVHQDLQKQRDGQRKKDEDQRIIQFILKTSPAKINTVQLLEEKIQQIEGYRAKLSDPAASASDIAQVLQSIEGKILSYRSRLSELRDRLKTLTTRKELEESQQECIDLLAILKGASDYPACQELQQQIKQLQDDFAQLNRLEADCQNISSILTAQEVLEALTQARSSFSDRFTEQLLELEQLAQQRIQKYEDNLVEFRQKLEDVELSQEAQKLRDTLLKQATCYARSSSESAYDALCQEANDLIELLRIGDRIRRTDDFTVFQAERNGLELWKTNHTINDHLTRRITALQELIRRNEQSLQEERLQATTNWIALLDQQATDLNRLEDGSEKLQRANDLIKQINSEVSQYELTEEQELALATIRGVCQREQNRDHFSRIVHLFQQLPRPDRARLYEELSQYLTAQTEIF
jgi:hypothetical protein